MRPACACAARCIELNEGQNDARNAQSVERLRATLASYSGHLRHGAAWRAWTAIWDAHPWLEALFARTGWGLEARWPGRSIAAAPSLRSQYAALLRRAGEDSLLFLEVGRFIEFYGPQRRLAARVLGLRRTRLRRACYAFTAGFPARLCAVYLRRALRLGFKVVWIAQEDQPTARAATGVARGKHSRSLSAQDQEGSDRKFNPPVISPGQAGAPGISAGAFPGCA